MPNLHKSIFEVLADTMKDYCNKYRVKIQWYIMTSKENNMQTIEFFKIIILNMEHKILNFLFKHSYLCLMTKEKYY